MAERDVHLGQGEYRKGIHKRKPEMDTKVILDLFAWEHGTEVIHARRSSGEGQRWS